MSQFEKLKTHLEQNGLKIITTETTNFVQSEKIINIHHRFNKEKNGLYSLLHEAGHWLQSEDPYYGQGLFEHINKCLDNSKKYNMLIFIHELDAWNRAEVLVHDLELSIDYRMFDKIKYDSLLTYFE